MSQYPILELEIFKRGIKKCVIAKSLGINPKTLSNKLSGRSVMSWPEACKIHDTFFPDVDKNLLFSRTQSIA